MRVAAITLSLCFGLAATAAAQGEPAGKTTAPDGASKSQLSQVRSIVRELERSSSKLSVLLTDVRSLLEQRPPKSQQKQLERWEAAFDQLLQSLRSTHATVVDGMKRLGETTTVKLPTSLAKEVADARNEAGPVRTAAEQVLKQHKPKSAKGSKHATKAPAAPDPDAHLLDDVDL